eukprot:SAG11_NODE_34399_length_272_cov_0.601156_2_plen_33_part_01
MTPSKTQLKAIRKSRLRYRDLLALHAEATQTRL